MKPFDYFLAGAALLPELVSGLSPAADSSLPAGWYYKGCYSDKWWNPSGNQVTPATQGVSAYPRALNGYFSQQRPNGATVCINLCLGANKGYIYAGTNDNSCFCDSVLARNGSSVGPPSYGIADADDSKCQFGCRGATTEACGGPGTNSANIQRLSLYQFGVSEFRNNAYVLKLKVLYLLFSFSSGPTGRDNTHTIWHAEYGSGEGAVAHWRETNFANIVGLEATLEGIEA